jgi:hypothetical protein
VHSKILKIFRTYGHYKRRRDILRSLDFGDKPNHFFLVSYPKSGNTWMRMILANLMKEGDQEIALHNVNSYIPDTHIAAKFRKIRDSQSVFNRLPYQFMKTHDPYFSFYRDKQVIYIVRDGRDALNSYYHYLQARNEGSISMLDLIRGKHDVPKGSWSQHIISWTHGACKRIIVIKYEDLIVDASTQIRKLLELLNWQLDDKRVQEAINSSSFQNLKHLEMKYGWMQEARTESGKNIAFFRKGQAMDWQNTFSETDILTFWKYHKEGMSVSNYY